VISAIADLLRLSLRSHSGLREKRARPGHARFGW
jgi:hypothetical protein